MNINHIYRTFFHFMTSKNKIIIRKNNNFCQKCGFFTLSMWTDSVYQFKMSYKSVLLVKKDNYFEYIKAASHIVCQRHAFLSQSLLQQIKTSSSVFGPIWCWNQPKPTWTNTFLVKFRISHYLRINLCNFDEKTNSGDIFSRDQVSHMNWDQVSPFWYFTKKNFFHQQKPEIWLFYNFNNPATLHNIP